MSENYVEKNFLYLVVLSLLLHVGLFALIASLPEKKPVTPPAPIMVDLENLPELQHVPQQRPPHEPEAKRQADRYQRVPREMAPKGTAEQDRIAPVPPMARPAPRSTAPPLSRPAPQPAPRMAQGGKPAATGTPGEIPVRQAPEGGGVLRPRAQRGPDLAQLMPGAERMAKLEDSYRKKYSSEVAEGETKFLDTDDIQFGSFLRRFENSVYGIWRYPAEAAQLGIEGVVPVKITFNGKGEIEKYEILQGSGSRILDSEVERTLRLVGPVGPFPRGYRKATFNLIAFFQYGIVRGASRSLH